MFESCAANLPTLPPPPNGLGGASSPKAAHVCAIVQRFARPVLCPLGWRWLMGRVSSSWQNGHARHTLARTSLAASLHRPVPFLLPPAVNQVAIKPQPNNDHNAIGRVWRRPRGPLMVPSCHDHPRAHKPTNLCKFLLASCYNTNSEKSPPTTTSGNGCRCGTGSALFCRGLQARPWFASSDVVAI